MISGAVINRYLPALSAIIIYDLVRLDNMDSSWKSFADAVKGQESNSCWRWYQAEDDEEAL